MVGTTASNFSVYMGIMYVMLHRHLKWDVRVCVVVTLEICMGLIFLISGRLSEWDC